MKNQMQMSKALITLALFLPTLVHAQSIPIPWNPDSNVDGIVGSADLMAFITVFGTEWMPQELMIEGMPLVQYLDSLQTQTGLPEGTTVGEFLTWDGTSWQLVLPRVGCTLPEACNYDAEAHVLDEDKCVMPDECGVCDGPGAVEECGCSAIPEGACDCEGNVLDALGVCGGGCAADADGDGICDDGEGCPEDADECGVCNGPGAVYACGCFEPVDGDCDTVNGQGCTYVLACNYDPEALYNDGSCDFVSCIGCTDEAACNFNPDAVTDNGNCLYGTEYRDCVYTCLIDVDADGVCDDEEVLGCTVETACNFNPFATELDESCTFPGCLDSSACNFNAEAGCDDGTCVFGEGQSGCLDSSACNFDPNAQCSDGSCEYLDPCGVCGGSGSLGCTNPLAENFDAAATCDDGSCNVFGCTSPLACNYEPTANVEDDSCVFGSCPGCNDPTAFNFNPTSTNDELCNACGTSMAYEGSIYHTELVAGQCWMIESLRYLPAVTPEFHNVEGVAHFSVGGYNGTDVAEALSQLGPTDGVLYDHIAAANLDLCPSGFHVPDDTEWDSFLSEGGTIQLQGDEVSFICNGDGASSDGSTIFWSSSEVGAYVYGLNSDFIGSAELGCCAFNCQALIKCVSDE